jgi:hypothetical protein
MSIVSVVVTASHRYYARKRKSDLIHCVQNLQRVVGVEETPYSELKALTRDSLAYMAMRLHGQIPE